MPNLTDLNFIDAVLPSSLRSLTVLIYGSILFLPTSDSSTFRRTTHQVEVLTQLPVYRNRPQEKSHSTIYVSHEGESFRSVLRTYEHFS